MKFCPECGNQLLENAKFCPECGYKILQLNNESNVIEEKFDNSEIYIKKIINSIPQDTGSYKISISPKISDKNLVNCASTIGNGVDPMLVVALIDTTIFKSGKEGVVFTGDTMYARPAFGKSIKIPFNNISDATYSEQEFFDNNNKKKIKKLITIALKDGDYMHISNSDYTGIPFETIAEILSNINHKVKKIETTEQLLQLKDMSQNCISLYLKIIINYLKEDDDLIDPREYKELISLMSRLKISKEMSEDLRNYRLQEFLPSVEDLIFELKQEIPTGSIPTIFQSLFNDILLTNIDEIENYNNIPLLKKYQSLLEVTDSQASFFIKKCKHDEEIINNKVADNTVKEFANELLALGGAAGVSLGALAVTGGIGTGIWGGLISLAVLPTGGMLLGLAAIGGLSYGAYKGVRYLAGTDELEKFAIRNAMLQEKIKEMQLSQSYLLDDINYTTDKIKELVSDKTKILENHSKLLKYINITSNLDNTSRLIHQDQNNKKLSLLLAKIPEILDKEKYDELIKQSPNKKIFNDFVFNFYELNDNNQYKLIITDDIECLEKIDEILTMIGYNDTKKSVAAKTNIMAKKGLEHLKGFIK